MRDRVRHVIDDQQPSSVISTVKYGLKFTTHYTDGSESTAWIVPEGGGGVYTAMFSPVNSHEKMRDQINWVRNYKGRSGLPWAPMRGDYDPRVISILDQYYLVNGNCSHSFTQRAKGSYSVNWTPVMPAGYPYIIEGQSGSNVAYIEFILVLHGSVRYEPRALLWNQAYPGDNFDPLNAHSWRVPGLDRARQRALEQVFPKLGQGFQMQLFLKEFKDIISVVGGLKLIVSALRRAPHIWREIRRALSGIEGSRNAANSHLWVQFGLLPLIGDLKKLFDTMVTLREQIANLRQRAGKLQEVHCQETCPQLRSSVGKGYSTLGFSDLPSFPWSGYPGNSPENPTAELKLHWEDVIDPTSVKYHLTVWYKYELNSWVNALEPFWLALDALGVNWSPSQYWQMVPFSFIVDWFLGVGKMLSQLDAKNVSLDVQIVGVVESVSYKWARRPLRGYPIEVVTPLSLDTAPGVDFALTMTDRPPDLFDGKVYERQCSYSLPVLPPRFTPRLPSGMRWVTLGSLLRQQFDTGGNRQPRPPYLRVGSATWTRMYRPKWRIR